MTAIEFNQSFELHTGFLQNYALTLTKDAENANDLFQETAYKAYKYQRMFRSGTNMRAWLTTIMKNTFINQYRQRRRRTVLHDGTENTYYLNQGEIEVANQGEGNILIQELLGLIEQLSPENRVPFLLHFQGYRYEEIARQLNLPLGTVKSRIHLARKRLREQIQQLYQTDKLAELAA